MWHKQKSFSDMLYNYKYRNDKDLLNKNEWFFGGSYSFWIFGAPKDITVKVKGWLHYPQ